MNNEHLIGNGLVMDAGACGIVEARDGFEGLGLESYAASRVQGRRVVLPIRVEITGRKRHWLRGTQRIRVRVTWLDDDEDGEPAGGWLYFNRRS